MHDVSVETFVAVEAVDGGEEFALRDIDLMAHDGGVEATGMAGAHLVGDVGLAGLVVPHEHDGEVRRPLSLCGQ